MLAFPLIGSWKPGQITIDWTGSTRPVIDQVERAIDTTWAEAMRRPGVHLFDGPMCRFEAMELRGDQMHLTLSTTSYKPFLGTNLRNAHLADVYGRRVLANPVGVSAALLSSDQFLLLGRRNASVAYYPSRVHPFAGCLEPAENLDVFDEVRRELREELAMKPGDIAELICTGIAEDLSLRQPEMIFAATTRLTRRQVEAQLDPKEHRGVWSIPAMPSAIEQALKSTEQFTPVAVASMLLWGRIEFGEEWFAAHRP